jgi:hypothetical protein
MKKIVVIPCFAESHFTEFQIDNLIATINPDIIIYNEGLFPAGPENKGGVDESFKTKFCYNDTNLAWDTIQLQQIIHEAQLKYPDTRIIWNQMNYSDTDANECYAHAVGNFKDFGIDIEPGDLIFPLEGDVFFHENDMDLLNEYISKLNVNQGLQAPYLDFMENQYYVEGNSFDPNTIHQRRIVIKFGDWEMYNNIVKNFISQKYNMLVTFPRYIFHYAWWRPGKYKELRIHQLVRQPEYHQNFLFALEQANISKDSHIVIRPNRDQNDPYRYIVRIDIDHPKEITKHQNFIKC